MCITAVLALCLISACKGGDSSLSGQTETFSLSLILGDNSDWYRGAFRFAELVEERSGGRYRIAIYPHAQLAGQSQRTELEMLQSGVIDFSIESPILLSLVEERMGIFSLPWLFDTYDEAFKVLDGPLGREMLGLLPQKRIVGLAYGVNGFRQLTNSRNPVNKPEDISGMKVRVPGIRMYIEIFRLLGADPSSMNFGELFTALAQGTMDGQENPLSVIYSARLYEVQSYLTLWNYSYDPIILCVNEGLWTNFTDEQRVLFSSCARDAMLYQRKLVSTREAALSDSLEQRGMVVSDLTQSARQHFRELTSPIYSTYDKLYGGGLIGRFTDETEVFDD